MAGLGQLLLLLTFVVSYRFSKFILILILTWVGYIIWHLSHHHNWENLIIMRDVLTSSAHTLSFFVFTLRSSNSETVL